MGLLLESDALRPKERWGNLPEDYHSIFYDIMHEVVECYFYILLNLNSNWKRNCPILYHDELVSLPTPSGIRCASSQIISEQLGQYLPFQPFSLILSSRLASVHAHTFSSS